MFWPVFVVAILAAIIASQAMLSGAFAILSKALSLGCFPCVKVVHTSIKYEGQVYIPEVNFLIGAASVAVTLKFQTSDNLANAYGFCVVMVFSITTHLMAVVMLLVWRTHPVLVAAFYAGFGFVEFLYLSSILSKFAAGGYMPFCFALLLMAVMASWHYFHVRRYCYEMDRAMAADQLAAVLARNDVRRVPGVGLLYSELVQGIPLMFPRLIDLTPSVQAVLVFVSVKHLPILGVPPPERFIFRLVGPAGNLVFRCVARYGYTDQLEGHVEFAAFLLGGLKMFVQEEAAFARLPNLDGDDEDDAAIAREVQRAQMASAVQEEQRLIDLEAERGVVYLMGESSVKAAVGSSVLKRVVVNGVYGFLKKNLQDRHKVGSGLVGAEEGGGERRVRVPEEEPPGQAQGAVHP
jgi:KUP system potassium uptake protein